MAAANAPTDPTQKDTTDAVDSDEYTVRSRHASSALSDQWTSSGSGHIPSARQSQLGPRGVLSDSRALAESSDNLSFRPPQNMFLSSSHSSFSTPSQEHQPFFSDSARTSTTRPYSDGPTGDSSRRFYDPRPDHIMLGRE